MNCSGRHIFRLASLCVVVLTMVGSLSSCRRYAGDEQAVGSALAMADSLRYDSPEAADSIIRSLDADSLGSRANAALYALLANEVGRYDDQVAAADSLADIATDYYRLRSWLSDDAGRLYARALMQKANLYSLLHDSDLAFHTLTKAENALSETDVELMGDIHRWRGRIYSQHSDDIASHIDCYRKAYDCYLHSDKMEKAADMLSEIGAAYRTHDLDSALVYINRSDSIARLYDLKKVQVKNIAFLSAIYKLIGDYRKAIATGLSAISSPDFQSDDLKETYYVICDSYLHLDMVDSAMHYLQMGDFDADDPKQSLMATIVSRKAARQRGDYQTAYDYSGRELQQMIQIIDEAHRSDITLLEHMQTTQKLEYEKAVMLVYAIIASVVVATLIICWVRFRRKKQAEMRDMTIFIDNLHKEMQRLKDTNNSDVHELALLREQLADYEQQLTSNHHSAGDAIANQTKTLLDQYIITLNDIKTMESFADLHASNPTKYISKFKKVFSDIAVAESFWVVLRSSVNAQYDNLLHREMEQHPDLTDQDLNLMAMMLAGYSNEIISFSFGFSAASSLYNRQNRLKTKLGIDTSLSKYLEAQKMS